MAAVGHVHTVSIALVSHFLWEEQMTWIFACGFLEVWPFKKSARAYFSDLPFSSYLTLNFKKNRQIFNFLEKFLDFCQTITLDRDLNGLSEDTFHFALRRLLFELFEIFGYCCPCASARVAGFQFTLFWLCLVDPDWPSQHCPTLKHGSSVTLRHLLFFIVVDCVLSIWFFASHMNVIVFDKLPL